MPVPDFKTYSAIFDHARTERVKQAASDLRARGNTMFAS
jgi:hypothetical protein